MKTKTRSSASSKQGTRKTPRTAKSTKKRPSAGVKRTKKAATRKKAASASRARSSLLAGLKRSDGLAAVVAVSERIGKEQQQQHESLQIPVGSGGGGGGGAAIRRAAARLAKVAPALSAISHEHRIRMMAELLTGPKTYQDLQKLTKLKAGPLYHHINQLRLAELILPKQRDTYELTRGGRNLILAAMALAPLISDKRQRPKRPNP